MRAKYFKYIIATFAFLCVCFHSSAYEVHGYVKTRGRMVNGVLKPGTVLPGVMIRVNGSNSVRTDSKGTFTLHIQSAGNFKISTIQKQGYVLVDKDLLARTFTPGNSALIIVMDKEDNILADRNVAERKIQHTLQRQLENKENEIEKLREEQKITEEEYHNRLAALYDLDESNRQLISEMAIRYTNMDYDILNEEQRQIALCVENGELAKADSLQNSRGNVQDRFSLRHKKDSIIDNERSKLEELERFMIQERNELGADLLSRSQIYLMKNDVDSAMFYLDIRADLDSTSVQWALQAGDFALKYKYDYSKSLDYYQRALRHALNQSSSEQSEEIADCYCRIASVFVNEANYFQAYNYYRNALNLRQHLYGTSDPRTAEVIEQLGMIYNSMGQYDIAHEHIEKALNIFVDEYRDVYGELHANIASCYDNMGVVLDNLGEYEKAKEYTDKALHLFVKLYSPNDIKVAACYSNLGGILENLEDTENAIENYSKSIEIYLENHREYEAAVIYNNVGTLYYNVGEFNKAHDSFNQAVLLIKKHEAEDHPVYRKILENMKEVNLRLQHVSD